MTDPYKNIIITAPVHPDLIIQLQNKGYMVIYEPAISYKSLFLIINQAQGLIVTTRIRIDKSLIDKAVKLKWIGRLGSGMELIDEAYANTKGIHCYSTPEGNRQAVAEHVLGMILTFNNNIIKSYLEIKEGLWIRNENRGVELSGKTVGIIGYGNAGSALAQLLKSFGVKVLAYDKYKSQFGNEYVTESSLAEIQAAADVISFHVPLTEETFHMIDDVFLQNLVKCPLIVNASRGQVMNTKSVIRALKSEWIQGICLDVLENEQLEFYTQEEQKDLNWLLEQTNVIITPHIAGYSNEAFLKMGKILVEKIGL
jgi:D-3-phosphoglycerate dehydrogenase / 2-oxoglutarate reductase